MVKLGEHHHSEETKEKIRKGIVEWHKKHDFYWKDAMKGKKHTPEWNKKISESRKRDNYTCQQCGYTQSQIGYKLHVHHIDYDKKNNNQNNLISLCRTCHGQTNFNRNDWISYFHGGKIL